MSGIKSRRLRGDTMVEVMFSITAYSIVALFTITTMRSGLAQSETVLETSHTRTEIAAQADALRFIHNGFVAEREYLKTEQVYQNLWREIASKAINSDISIPELSTTDCSSRYVTNENNNVALISESFVINLRKLELVEYDTSKFIPATLYPRIIYQARGAVVPDESALSDGEEGYLDVQIDAANAEVAFVEGLWVIARKSATTDNSQPEYYDFHIYSCWNAPGSDQPTTIGTIVRLYNPELRSGS